MSELFTELSDQQQELVAGGLNLSNFTDTDFSQTLNAAAAVGASASGPAGSVAGGSVTALSDIVDTSGTSELEADTLTFLLP